MQIHECLNFLGKDLLTEITEHSVIKTFHKNDFVIHQGQIVHSLPIVLDGQIRVFSQEDTIEFLLYYIQSGESCIFSFAHIFSDNPLEFSAKAERNSKLLFLPINKVRTWLLDYPRFNKMILDAYQKHYEDLLLTTKQIICYNLEARLINYLQEKSRMDNTQVLQVTHNQIANDLGTSREVITRLIKKLQAKSIVIQDGRTIKVLG